MNKKYFFSHRVTAMLLTLALCLGMIPTAFAAQQNSYHDPAEHWMEHDADVFGAVGCRSKFFR